MKIAVLSSPSARNRFEMGSALGHFLEGDTILTHPLWGDVPSGRMIASLENGAHLSYKEAVRQAVTRFLEEGAGLFVTIGGDGLASYVADALVCGTSPDSRPGIIGVAAGTANVGPIVSLSIQDLKRCNRSDSTMKPLDAVEATLAGRHLGYGFNDIVLGNTVLATVDGKTWAYLSFSEMGTMDNLIWGTLDEIEKGITEPKQAMDKAASDLLKEMKD